MGIVKLVKIEEQKPEAVFLVKSSRLAGNELVPSMTKNTASGNTGTSLKKPIRLFPILLSEINLLDR